MSQLYANPMAPYLSRIPYTKPSITQIEIDYATDAARSGWGEHCYEYIYRFQNAFSAHLGVKHAIATSSCTGALHMGLSALGIGPGDEVILADTNWIATVAPVAHLGATPVFVDILPDTWCIDPDRVWEAITDKTKAIIVTHLYGNLCDMTNLLGIGQRCGIPIIEDAAEAIGSQWLGKRAGSMGAFGAFSFHGSKTMTTGEGGMFVTEDPVLYEKVLTLSNHGRDKEEIKQFWASLIGFKYKMSNIQAAIGLGQIERIDELIARKRQILKYYRTKLDFLPLTLNSEPEGAVNGAWMPTAVFSAESKVTREKLLQAFTDWNIDARVFFYPLSGLPMFERISPVNTYAENIPGRAINLPSYHDMEAADQDRVIEVIRQVCHHG